MTVFLIRHGQTIANEQHLYCGSTDLPLSKAGREALASRPSIDVGAARFITSGMRRCNETLALLFGGVPYEVMRDFREIDFGAFELPHLHVQFCDQSVTLHNRNKISRCHNSLLRMLPAHQRFQSDDLTCVQITFRLKIVDKLISFQTGLHFSKEHMIILQACLHI